MSEIGVPVPVRTEIRPREWRYLEKLAVVHGTTVGSLVGELVHRALAQPEVVAVRPTMEVPEVVEAPVAEPAFVPVPEVVPVASARWKVRRSGSGWVAVAPSGEETVCESQEAGLSVVRAALAPNPKAARSGGNRPRFTEEHAAVLRRMHGEGEGAYAIARVLGLSYQLVQYHTKRLGLVPNRVRKASS